MNERIQQLLSQISELEKELQSAINEQPAQVMFHIKGKRIEFEQSIKQTHKKLKTGLFRWLVTNRPLNLITGPIIYSMIIPLVITDLFISFYQWSCFPIYGIAKVKRSDYIAFDRHALQYLNSVEKFHCNYCDYANGMIAYITEIVARTEQYFCPIKHARKLLGTHARYASFLEYGDAKDYPERLESFRNALNHAAKKQKENAK